MAPSRLLWETANMTDVELSPLQALVAQAIDALPETRNFYDRQIQGMLKTSGKPLYDLARKDYRPKRATLKAMADALGQPIELFERALDGEKVSLSPAIILNRRLAGTHPSPDQLSAQSVDAGETVPIIKLDLSLPMGPGATVDDYVEEEPLLFDLAYVRAFTRTPPHRLRLAGGAGDSMFPTLVPNDMVWIDTTQNELLHADRIYAASINGGAAIKRLRPIDGGRRVLVISDNKTVEPYPVDADEVRIWGRVIRYARDL